MRKQDTSNPLSDIASFLWYIFFYSVFKLAKYIWKAMAFTGTWPFVLSIIVFGMNPQFASDYLIFPIFLTMVFPFFWTGRNLYKIYKSRQRLEKMRTVAFKGVFFGVMENKLRLPLGRNIWEDGHVLVVGGAGTGKSSCIAIPTLKYFWDSRFLAVDIKGELAEKSGREACIFNPCKPDAYGYDPFHMVRNVSNPVSQIREIAMTVAPAPPDIKDPFWIQSAQNILTGHLLYNYNQGESFIQALNVIQRVPPQVLLEVAARDEQAAMFVTQYMGIKEETLSSIMSTLSNHIIPFLGDTDIQEALSKKDIITPNLLEEGRDIFLQMPEYKINQWKALITLILQQFLTHFEQRPEGSKTPILFMIDEFARFGKMEGIIHGLATLRSKKITICIIIQSLAQLDAIYGHEQRKIIADNCAYKAVLGATDADTQRYFSSLVGTHLVQQESYTKDMSSPFAFQQSVVSSNISTVEKAIIRPEEFACLDDIILLTPHGNGRAEKQPYYLMQQYKPLAGAGMVQSATV